MANLMLLFASERALTHLRLFQQAKSVGYLPTESEHVTMQLVPEQQTRLLPETFHKIHRQRAMTGADDVFPKLFLVRCEYADAPPTA